MQYSCIVIGVSAGGLYALSFLLEKFPGVYPIPILIVQHRAKDQAELLEELLGRRCQIAIKQADEKEKISGGVVYLAPPAYHLLVEADHTISLSSDEHVFSKPSIDILFESAAEVFREKLIGIVLTGANSDGSKGITAINKYGGLTIAQDTKEAQYPYMPQAAINTGKVSHVWSLSEIQKFLLELPLKMQK
jgi:two-component system, chemotaxis family, protein-glutamate methylesterase/glutaminase